MLGNRRQVNYLLAEGHQFAREYPVHLVWEEHALAKERADHTLASQAVLLQLAGSACITKEAAQAFKKTIAEMTHEQT